MKKNVEKLRELVHAWRRSKGPNSYRASQREQLCSGVGEGKKGLESVTI